MRRYSKYPGGACQGRQAQSEYAERASCRRAHRWPVPAHRAARSRRHGRSVARRARRSGAFRRRVVIKVLAPERRGDPRIAGMLADEAAWSGSLTIGHRRRRRLPRVRDGGAHLRARVRGRVPRCAAPSRWLASGANGFGSLAAHVCAGRRAGPERGAHRLRPGRQPLHLVHRDIASDNVLLSRSGAVYLGASASRAPATPRSAIRDASRRASALHGPERRPADGVTPAPTSMRSARCWRSGRAGLWFRAPRCDRQGHPAGVRGPLPDRRRDGIRAHPRL